MWTLNRVKFKNTHHPSLGSNNISVNQESQMTSGCNKKKTHIVVPNIQRLSESFMKVCGKHEVQVYFKGGDTIKGLLVVPKDKDVITKKVG